MVGLKRKTKVDISVIKIEDKSKISEKSDKSKSEVAIS